MITVGLGAMAVQVAPPEQSVVDAGTPGLPFAAVSVPVPSSFVVPVFTGDSTQVSAVDPDKTWFTSGIEDTA